MIRVLWLPGSKVFHLIRSLYHSDPLCGAAIPNPHGRLYELPVSAPELAGCRLCNACLKRRAVTAYAQEADKKLFALREVRSPRRGRRLSKCHAYNPTTGRTLCGRDVPDGAWDTSIESISKWSCFNFWYCKDCYRIVVQLRRNADKL